MTKLATQIGKDVKVESSYRRLQRFFSKSHFSPNDIALFITRLFFNDSIKWTLAIDRTNWPYGRVNINILMLSICYKGRAIPVFWMMLNKKGNSTTCERIQRLNRFVRLFGQDRIEALTADREFIGKDFFNYLGLQGIPFVIRIKKSEITTNSRGLEANIDGLFYHLNRVRKHHWRVFDCYGGCLFIFLESAFLMVSFLLLRQIRRYPTV